MFTKGIVFNKNATQKDFGNDSFKKWLSIVRSLGSFNRFNSQILRVVESNKSLNCNQCYCSQISNNSEENINKAYTYINLWIVFKRKYDCHRILITMINFQTNILQFSLPRNDGGLSRIEGRTRPTSAFDYWFSRYFRTRRWRIRRITGASRLCAVSWDESKCQAEWAHFIAEIRIRWPWYRCRDAFSAKQHSDAQSYG